MKHPERLRCPTRRRLGVAGATALAAACAPSLIGCVRRSTPAGPPPEKSLANSIATIALGDPSASYLGPKGPSIDRKAVGIDFHEHDWPFDQLGTVRYAQGPYSFERSFVSGVMGTYNRDDPERGIYAWSITAFPMAGETIPHAHARDDLFRFFTRLLKAGWRRYISVGDPRLAGAQTMRYFFEQDSAYSLDPTYVPSLDEWMRLNKHLPY